jgi:hypothetical protein
MGTRGFFYGGKAALSPPSGAEVKECMKLYLHSPDTPSLSGAQLKERKRKVFIHNL